MSQIHREQLKVVAERAVLVAVLPTGRSDPKADVFRELRALAETAGAEVVGELVQKRDKPSGRTYLGKGKVRELADLVAETRATLVVFDNDLAPSQIKAIEEATECKVVDRSELILDIFANRAATHAAKLQVEIAQLEYTYPRLRAMWTHLEKIVGGAPVGIGTRGPGEKQLEIDRRIVQRRLRQLRRELATIQQRKSREVQRRNLEHYTVGLVGYTNAGKSSLLRTLSGADLLVEDRLFATLDSTTRSVDLGSGYQALITDTVGFIRKLPHHLVASFRSTLEEAREADVLLHVIDASHPDCEEQEEVVAEVLAELELDDRPQILVFNKLDRLTQAEEEALSRRVRAFDATPAVFLSAARPATLDPLKPLLKARIRGGLR